MLFTPPVTIGKFRGWVLIILDRTGTVLVQGIWHQKQSILTVLGIYYSIICSDHKLLCHVHLNNAKAP
ncbi:hypothetical protein M0657_004497 [Pyricularia oryzae]|uniref:Uncharacterized protein n=1 Tax=Pyricularia oryzae TaxID=318829 RepID=A0A4V1C5P1_PYROR|nr:hypothetical protein M0657_004497 [Pyricularia oryzae]KAI7925201.1 hypothetical protein M9X92_003380 [Pyricularia oryzae]QBZ57065.1 hypothetical protein PoMZ_01985 [Pyricularia oryzae]